MKIHKDTQTTSDLTHSHTVRSSPYVFVYVRTPEYPINEAFALRKNKKQSENCCGCARGSVLHLGICVSNFSLPPLMLKCYSSPLPPDSSAATSRMTHWRLEQCKIERNCSSRTDWLRSCLTHAWVIL